MHIKHCLLAAASLAALAGAPAHARDASESVPEEAAPQGGIQDIVVTAQKRSENIQDVPIAISAFTASALQERAVGDVSALSAIAPNVTLDASTPFSGSTSVLGASIRGIGSADFAFNIDPAVGVYLDGVYLARSVGANQDLLDVERIEVLKGPQGTLFGRNTIGGAISIVTHDPGDEFAFKGDLTTGSYRRMQVRGIVDVPISEGLTSSLAFAMMNRKGYQKRVDYPFNGSFVTDGPESFVAADRGTASRSGGDNNWSVRGKLKWDNGKGFKVTLTGDFTDVDQSATPNTVLGTTEFVPGPFGVTADRAIPGTALYNPANIAGENGTTLPPNGFLFAGLYNFCIGSTPEEIAARNAQNLCGPRSSVNGFGTLPGLGSVNVDGNPFNDRLPYDSRWTSANSTGDIDTTYATGPNFSKLQQGGVNLTLDVPLGEDINLKSISAWRKVDFRAGIDLDNSPINILELTFSVEQEQLSQELQLSGKALDDRLNFVIGGYAFKESGDLHDYVNFSEGLLQIDGPGEVKTVNFATYGQLDYRVNDLIGLTVGGRYTHEKKNYHGFQSDLNGFNYKLFNCMPPSETCRALLGFPVAGEPFRYYPELPDEQTFSNFSPKAGIQIHPADDVMGYFTWSRGYRTGGWTTRLSNPLPDAPTFGPEKAETFEIGLKSMLLDRRLQINLAAFTTKYKGIQLNQQVGVSPTVKNQGDARIKGFEAEALVVPGGGFSVQGSVGYIDAYYTSINPDAVVQPNPFQAGVFAGAALPKAPHWKVNVSPRYETSIGEGTIVLLADWTHTTSMRNDTEGTFLIMRPATDVINVSVTYKEPNGHWELTVGGTNLTDERYIVTGQAQVAGGQIYGTYSRPVEWYARLGFSF